MAKPKDKELELLYAAAERFVSVALKGQDSLFTPGKPVWSDATIQDLYERFVEHPDESHDLSFMQKLEKQLEGAPPDTFQLAAELTYIHLLPAFKMRGQTKREAINTILGWSRSPVAMPTELSQALDKGLASEGTAFHTHRPNLLIYLLNVMKAWRALAESERTQALSDPWAFKSIAFGVKMFGARSQAEILLHLVHPDAFEDIMSQKHKAEISKAFQKLITTPGDDIDRQILQIRQALERQCGRAITFYEPEILERWSPQEKPWDLLVKHAKLFYQLPNFDENERNYKLRVAEKVKPLLATLSHDDNGVPDQLRKLMRTKDQNIVRWQDFEPFIGWYKNSQPLSHMAIAELLAATNSPGDAIRRFLKHVPKEVLKSPASRTTFCSFLLFCTDPKRFVPFQARVFDWGYKVTGYPAPSDDADEADRYLHALAFLEQMSKECSSRDLPLRDLLDAQGVLYAMAKYENKPEAMAEKDWLSFLQFSKGRPDLGDEEEDTDDEAENEDEGLGSAAEGLITADPVGALLLQRTNVVLYGPPGTGKTHASLNLAENWRRWQGLDSVFQVTFHPTFAYEDFVEGFRPNPSGQFELRSGIFVKACEQAHKEPARKFLLIVDELNRGDVARIFGELITLIEADKRHIGTRRKLPYSHHDFWVPPNLYLLGTMNTADRSISLLDIAIRRRFCFMQYRPEPTVVRTSVRHLQTVDGVDLAGLLEALNRRLIQEGIDRDRAIGHSHFMIVRDDPQPLPSLRNRLRYDIIPLVEEYCYANRSMMRKIFGQLVDEKGDTDEGVLAQDAPFIAALKAIASDPPDGQGE